ILDYKDKLKSLLQTMVSACKSERGYTTTSRILAITLMTLTNTWVRDYRSVNKAEWESEDFQKRSHESWGRAYEVKDVKVEWHVATAPEIEFVLELLHEIVLPALDRLDQLLVESQLDGKVGTMVWINDFCRFLNVVRSALSGIPSLALLERPENLGQQASDAGDEIPEFIDHMPTCEAAFPLKDPKDPRHRFIVDLRERCADFLHRAIQVLKASEQDDSVDAIKMVIASIRVLELDYPCDTATHGTIKKSYEFATNISRVTRNQKEFPRFVWVRRAGLYHTSRLRLNSFYRKRSKLDDQLIFDLAELSLSAYLGVRRVAQRALDSMIHYFDGTRMLIYPRLFDALKAGTAHDVMKGALYVLGAKAPQNLAILDWRVGPTYILAILSAQWQERPSVQSLIKTISHDYIIRLSEISSLRGSIASPGLEDASNHVEELISLPQDSELVQRVTDKVQQRIKQKNEAYDDLLPKLLEIAQDPKTHWRYTLIATRFLRALIRRDQPQRPELAAFMAHQLVSELPNQRTHAMLATTKLLHFIKLRTTSEGSDRNLLLQQSVNPLRRKIELPRPLPANFTDKFIASSSEPLASDAEINGYVDKSGTGWLVWGDVVEYYAVPPEDGSVFDWDTTSEQALQQLREVIIQPGWWDTFIQHLSMEKSVDYLAADICMLVKSIFQIFEDAPFEFVLPAAEALLEDSRDRHKQRAAGELIGGIVRGSKHWSLSKQKKLWDWLSPKLPELFQSMTVESQVSIEMLCEYILNARDPRRNQPLIEYITSLSIDDESSEAFNVSKQQDLVGTAMKALSWRFTPWADSYIEMYSKHIAHPYQEVRTVIADNLRVLCELRLHPSYSSVEEFLRDAQRVDGTSKSLVAVDSAYEARIDEFGRKLAEWREERKPASEGAQAYDKASMTILTWIWSSVSEFRTSSAFPFITKLLPELFKMQETTDNPELTRMAGRVLLACAALQFPVHLVKPLMRQFIDLLRNSKSWRTRLDIMLPLQVFFFHHLFFLSDATVSDLMDALVALLSDEKVEVREAAANTLSGIVRCSQRSAIAGFIAKFRKVLKETKIPKRRDKEGKEVAGYQPALLAAHSAVLGISSLLKAFPYEVPPFVPSILLEMGRHSTSPPPVSMTVRATLRDWKASHSDGWHEDQKAFTSDQLVDLQDLLSGGSYYA
ncbi:hypothetical protein JCM11641_001615, partial [Rhodosporidiobolus odoratus]